MYNLSANPTIAAAYSSNGASQTSADYKITTDSGGSTIVWSKTGDATNLTSIVVNTSNGTFAGALSGQTQLAANTLYYAFVRHTNGAGTSSWSTAVSFTTSASTNTSTFNSNFSSGSNYSIGSSAEVASSVGRLLDLGGGTYATSAPSSLSAWTRRKAITVTNNVASTLTNDQIKVTVAYDSDMKADFGDIRFTDSDGSTLLDHWMESSTASTTADYWVEIPTLTASSSKTIYMYYGNAGATTASNGTNTFMFFDDFSSGSMGNWTAFNGELCTAPTITMTGGVMQASGSSKEGGAVNTGYTFTNGILEAKMQYVTRTGNGQESHLYARTTSGNNPNGYRFGPYWSSSANVNMARESGHNLLASGTFDYGTGVWRKISFKLNGSSLYGAVDGTDYIGPITNSTYSSGYVGFGLDACHENTTTLTVQFDDYRVRQYVSSEPSVSVGSEVAAATESQISISNNSTLTATYVGLGTFTETLGGGNLGSISYQLSNDGTNWKYWNGMNWAAASTGNYNSATVVNNFLPQFTTDIGKGNIYVKSFLLGTNQYTALDNVAITYEPLTVALSASTQTVAESVGTVTVTAQSSGTFTSDIVIPYTVSGTATGGGTDHNLANGNITITTGATTGTTTFSVVDDAIADPNETVIVTMGTPNFGTPSGVTVQTITITDNDTAGVTVVQSGGTTTVTEGAATDTYTVVLNSQPTATVAISVTPNAQLTTNVPTLSFTTGNWNTPQTVTVSAANDSIAEGSHSGTVTHVATSVDSNYNGISVATITAGITDDDTPSVLLSESTVSGTEGGTDTYTVVLSSQPVADVVVTILPDAATTVDLALLTFTAVNWNVPQTVTVTFVDDTSVQGQHAALITQTVASADPNYDLFVLASITATIEDNDVAPSTGGDGTGGGGFSGGGGGGSHETHHEVYNPNLIDEEAVTENADELGIEVPEHWSEGYMKNLIQEQYIVEAAVQEISFFDVLASIFATPNKGMTRAQALEFLMVTAQVDMGTVTVDTSRPTFKDVLSTNTFVAYIEFAAKAGLVNGYPDGTFKPDHIVNRAEALKLATTFFNFDFDASLRGQALLSAYGLESNPFTDVDLSQWYAPYVIYMYANHVVSGYGNGTFGPGNTVTYAEFLKIATLARDIENAVELASELE